MRRSLACSVSLVVTGLVVLAGCGDGGGKTAPLPAAGAAPAKGGDPPADAAAATSAEDALIEKYKSVLDIPMVTYAWDKNAGDKSVSAELGGPGFTGEGWTTNLTYPALGVAAAPKGGTMRMYLADWPNTLRMHGENWNLAFNYNVAAVCLESLINVHPTTLETIPMLATHWKISADHQTYMFRINPEARWSDGSEVTTADVIATWKLRMDPTAREPSALITYGKFDPPVAKSKYVLEVHCKEDAWLNFLAFGQMSVLPAKDVSITGAEYLDKFQNAYTAVSGMYMVQPEDIKLGQSIALTRRKDWWGAKNPANAGLANIDRFEWSVVKDLNLAYEKMKKGELDLYVVPRAQWWAEEIPKFESVKRGVLQMRKIFNDYPIGTNGIGINMKKAPLDDNGVRLALQLLYNRRLMIKKLCYDEYAPLTSYYQGGVYANPDNKEYGYDPVGAVELLEKAGWKDVNAELYRVKDGKVLELQLIYDNQLSERFLTPYQQDCQKAGIKLNLKLLTPAAFFKNFTQKEFELAELAWGSNVFPNPEVEWKGELADQLDNNNGVGFKDARADAIIAEYNKTYDINKRIALIRELDGIIYNAHPYVLNWYPPFVRFVFWNKFGMPPWGCDRILSANDQFWASFWVDPAKEKALDEALKDAAKTMPVEDRENRFWQAWDAAANRRRKESGK
jgi:microcin C transport system substrate-binding protein